MPAGPQYALEDVHGLQDVIDRRNFERMAERFVASGPEARRMLLDDVHLDDPSLLEELAALPADTLGGAFARFMHDHALNLNLTDSGALAGSRHAEYAKQRHRETHDLVHVLLGLGVTPRDEILVQAFTSAQNLRWVSVGIVLGGLAKHGRLAGDPQLRRDVTRAFAAGRRAHYLLGVRWESHWSDKLDDLRARVNIEVFSPRT